ncbi:MAG: hypothetical protein PQJ61_06945 [Spirochaetales bacterium]|uniref:Uncharacterized protein n=1 Tax=Candidatus Thalassospirochaeta sargassi TaxID=3119039 RepID=A0AAJ1IC49_9SPIO|nr:hypothetical protein [Spirochaetales bacterium]
MKQIEMQTDGFYRIIPMKEFRRTPGVEFHIMTKDTIPRIDGVDRVIHETDALSPGSIGDIARPWYMHRHQDDNLLVLSGKRTVDIYHRPTKQMLSFEATRDEIKMNGETVYSEPAILVWPRGVFHRIKSGKEGSASLNLATRYEGFDIKTNFSIYDLNIETGEYREIRRGDLDQR